MSRDTESIADVVLVAVVAVLLLASVVPTHGTGDAVVFGVGLDKWFHVIGFAALAIATAVACHSRGMETAKSLVVVGVLGVVLGAGIELLQWQLPWRRASTADVLADIVGGVLGAAGWLLRGRVRRIILRRRS